MNDDALRQDLFLLIGYLLTSAHGLYEEPSGYGPFRLLDAAGRLLAIMETHGLADPFLQQLEDAIRAERFGHSDDQELRATLNELCLRYAAELKERYPTKEEKV
ncbi:MAG: hypothetical protein H8E90_02455 [Anaerolineales bacterium]|nr:hypothetical protein [Anaerolineales bacterium]